MLPRLWAGASESPNSPSTSRPVRQRTRIPATHLQLPRPCAPTTSNRWHAENVEAGKEPLAESYAYKWRFLGRLRPHLWNYFQTRARTRQASSSKTPSLATTLPSPATWPIIYFRHRRPGRFFRYNQIPEHNAIAQLPESSEFTVVISCAALSAIPRGKAPLRKSHYRMFPSPRLPAVGRCLHHRRHRQSLFRSRLRLPQSASQWGRDATLYIPVIRFIIFSEDAAGNTIARSSDHLVVDSSNASLTGKAFYERESASAPSRR